jgi:hypothetical protein
VTHLIERITIHLTIHRDEEENFPFDNPWLQSLPFKGRRRANGVTVEWERSGAMEEHEPGDN